MCAFDRIVCVCACVCVCVFVRASQGCLLMFRSRPQIHDSRTMLPFSQIGASHATGIGCTEFHGHLMWNPVARKDRICVMAPAGLQQESVVGNKYNISEGRFGL